MSTDERDAPAETDATMAGHSAADAEDADGLLSQLRLIEDQPVGDRAAAFTQIHDRLRSRLEGGDSAQGRR